MGGYPGWNEQVTERPELPSDRKMGASDIGQFSRLKLRMAESGESLLRNPRLLLSYNTTCTNKVKTRK